MKPKFLLLKLYTTIFLLSCQAENKSYTLKGNLDYLGEGEFFIEKEPLHYKYSPKQQYPISVDKKGNFDIHIPVENTELAWLVLDDDRFPLILKPGHTEKLTITRADFPQQISFQDATTNYSPYIAYLNDIEGLDTRIEKEMNNFRDGLENQAIELSLMKIEIAKQHLTDTPFSRFILQAQGEYLVNRIKSVEYQFYKEGFDADKERQAVLEEAKELGFFTLQSLKAQRAGIRDFSHYYARTFGIYNRIREEFGQNLAEYDIKRLGYEELNEKRLQVIAQIEDRQAEAYARMFLVAERIGELPLEVATTSYERYLNEFPEYEEYTSFLTYFYNEIKSVSPGQPAIAFSLPDENGKLHSMSDYRGKYVLLDFWAGWCQPCLEEFPHMQRIYAKYPREQFEIIGISTEEDESVWRNDIQRFRNPWIQLYGGNGFEQKTFRAYKGGGIPFYILVDPQGNIARYNDIRASFNLEEVLDQLITN